ncbi:hypothetical protein KDK95_08055 [Actinospica sp. MGRD01-02]|uniref:Uncharacterized protein n=1 Tax=Actinospica acidithermotolerans TaxID=2828514 RepID=A0A941E4R9_9ACTN|nr:hypothetical protein [Actinospica acidithermotolerans]MBR7826250.1 hypothetical protein [Actinospica acidithermotolerans]
MGGGDLPVRLAVGFSAAYAVVSALDSARHVAAFREHRENLREGDLSWRPSRTVVRHGGSEFDLGEISARCAAELGEDWQVQDASADSALLRRRRRPPLSLAISVERSDDSVRATTQARTDFWRRPDRGTAFRAVTTATEKISD